MKINFRDENAHAPVISTTKPLKIEKNRERYNIARVNAAATNNRTINVCDAQKPRRVVLNGGTRPIPPTVQFSYGKVILRIF